MRSTKLWISTVGILGVAAMAACTSDPEFTPLPNPGVGGGTGAGTPTTTTSQGGSTTTTTTTTGTGGNQGDGNDSFAEAQAIDIDMTVQGQLEVETDFDYYSFTGTAGQVLIIDTDAKPDTDPFADGYIDLVLELYNDNEELIATNDDRIPRTSQDSRLYTRLPADGTYYIRVSDFCHWSDVELNQPCMEPRNILEPGYALAAINIDFTEDGNVNETEGGTMEYGSSNGQTNSGYFASLVAGTYDDAADVDTYEVTVPTDYTVDTSNGGRPTLNFQIYPAGPDGSGSTAPVGDVWATVRDATNGCSPTDPAIAKIDGTLLDPLDARQLSFPALTPAGTDLTGTANFTGADTFCLHIGTSASSVGTNPFYILSHFNSGSNEIESTETTLTSGVNDTIIAAETPQITQSGGGNDAYFVGGDLVGGTDVDIWALDLSTITNSAVDLFVACSSRGIGSGLTGFTARVLGDDASNTQLASESETVPDNVFTMDGVMIPANATTLYLELSATGIDAGTVGAQYQCGANFVAPTN